MTEAPRTPSPIDALANRYYAARLALSPIEMTSVGIAERQDEYDDFSPDGLAAEADLAGRTLAELDALVAVDDVDRVTAAAMHERLGLDTERRARNQDLLSINGIASGLHAIREVYELMPADTARDWDTINARLTRIPEAINGWFASQQAAVAAGLPPAVRQVELLATQCRGWAREGGYFDDLLGRADAAGDRYALTDAIVGARQAYLLAADRLIREIAPVATSTDAVGPERYELASREFVGAKVDFAETYRWGLDEVARIEDQQRALAEKLRPGLGVRATKDALDDDPAYLLTGTDALRAWTQARADEAIDALHGVHFDIPEPARTIQCRIADTHDGGIWYTSPTDDWTRPGQMWWSVPDGVTTFGTWRELTTVYHEGVPGHHLQCSQAIWRRDTLNNWRRNGLWVSGHGEGWALYAEQLMAELGFLEDSGMMLGMLDSQALRAVRVVLDIGLHCGLEAPDEVGGGEWTFEKAWDYFNRHVSMEEGLARFEVLRYFGWPGQAPSYKLGQRCWLELRGAVQQRQGADFDLKAFHARALDLGSVGLDVLREAVLG